MEGRKVERLIGASVGHRRDVAPDGDRSVRREAQRPYRLVVQLCHHVQIGGRGAFDSRADNSRCGKRQRRRRETNVDDGIVRGVHSATAPAGVCAVHRLISRASATKLCDS